MFLNFENYPVLQGKWLLLSMVIVINSEICGLSWVWLSNYRCGIMTVMFETVVMVMSNNVN